MKVHLVVLVSVSFSGCAKPDFVFRGYIDQSGCSDVIEAERAFGAVITETRPLPEEKEITITEMSTTIFDQTAIALVECVQDKRFFAIVYVVQPDEAQSLAELFEKMAAESSKYFGKPVSFHETQTEGRAIEFRSCGGGAITVSENQPDFEFGYENVMLEIWPRSKVC